MNEDHHATRFQPLRIAIALLLAAVLGYAVATAHRQPQIGSSDVIHVVAGENFWGSLVSQLGGDKVQVTSVVSDPNADPHEYESNTTTARDIDHAQYVIRQLGQQITECQS
jgi:zinc/manganese transport system substrate-binding protein